MTKIKLLPGEREFEVHKSHRANISLARAVRDSEDLRRSFLRVWKPRARPMVNLKTILRTLQAKKIPFVLVGAHAIGSYTGRPRATKDVDILVRAGRNHVRAVNALERDVGTRAMDAIDFAWMVKHSNDEGQKPVDEARLEPLGEMVWPGGGGKEIVFLAAEVKAGKVPSLLAGEQMSEPEA